MCGACEVVTVSGPVVDANGVREDARAGGYLTTGRPSILFVGDNILAYGFRRLNVLYNDRLSNTLRNTETHMLGCYRQETR